MAASGSDVGRQRPQLLRERSARDLYAKENIMREPRRSEPVPRAGVGASRSTSRNVRLVENDVPGAAGGLTLQAKGRNGRPVLNTAGPLPSGLGSAVGQHNGRLSPRAQSTGPLGDITNNVLGRGANGVAGKRPLLIEQPRPRQELASRKPLRQRQTSAVPAGRRPAAASGVRCAGCGVNEGRPRTDGLCTACWRDELLKGENKELKELKRKREEVDVLASARGSGSQGAAPLTARAASTSASVALGPMSATARPFHPERRAQSGQPSARHTALRVEEPQLEAVPMQVDTPPPAPASAAASAVPASDAVMEPAAAAAPLAENEVFNTVFSNDDQNTQRVSEYAATIHSHLFELERRFVARPDVMDHQPDINKKMRAILLDWLVEVHERYHYRPETLFLAQNLVDRYLSARQVSRGRLQLVGTTCMMIAAKFEEIDVPKAEEFAYITEDTYSKAEVLSAECEVLSAIDYEVAVATPVHFVDRLSRANGSSPMQRHLTNYLLELGLLDVKWLRYMPSLVVSAAIFCSNQLTGTAPAWTTAMAHHSSYQEDDLQACASYLHAQLAAAKDSSLTAVRQKYSSEAFGQIALQF